MKKCVRITVSNIRDPDGFIDRVKRDVKIDGVEGVVEVVVPDMVELALYGLKEAVDDFVNELEGVLIRYNVKGRDHATFIVEPFFKDEDYRGVIRFLKRGNHATH
ncbi:MAG: hypothetical protein M1549_02750 [Candidatus Dependentiae bacterium]|nr:hypothetical protein [Candidatus Dependentiae bacterium]